jgi:hypothetical protein
MGWRQILNAAVPDFSAKSVKSPPNDTFSHFCHFSQEDREYKSDPVKLKADALLLDNLTEAEREAYQGWYDVMVGEKFNMSPDEAHAEAMVLLLKTSRMLKLAQATHDYEQDGYQKIFSTKLNRNIYLAKDEQAKKRVPDKSLQVFVESEIDALKGLSADEQMLMLEAKTIFNFNGVIEDGGKEKI